MTKKQPASPVDDSVAIPDEDNESQAIYQTPTPNSPSKKEATSTAPTSPPKAALRQPKTSQSHEMEVIRQKLLQQQEELRRQQEEIEEKALLRQTSDYEDEELPALYQHLVNLSYGIASPAPSPTLQQDFIPSANNAYFSYQPQFPPVNLRLGTHQPINLQRSMHPSQYRRERPPPQPVQVEIALPAPSPTLQQGFFPLGNYAYFNYPPQFPPQPVQGEQQQQSLRQRSSANYGAAAVPQPVTTQPQTIATPSQVKRQLPAETLKIFNKIRQNYKERSFYSDQDCVRDDFKYKTNVYFVFKSGRQVKIIYDNLEVFLRQYVAGNNILLRRHQKAPTALTEKAAWIAFLKSTDNITIKGYWDTTYLYFMLDCCCDASKMYLQDISFPKVAAYLLRQHLSQNIDTLLIDFRQSKTPSIDDVFTTFSLDCEERSHQYTSFTTIVSNFPQNEIIDTLVKKLRQYVSKKLIILVDEKPYDSYLRLLKTRQFVVAGFATYFAAKEEFIIFKHASNDGDLCIGLRAPKENSTNEDN